MPEAPDAFAEMQELALSLEARGVPSLDVVDAMFRLWTRASIRIAGRAGAAQSLREIADTVEGDGAPTTH